MTDAIDLHPNRKGGLRPPVDKPALHLGQFLTQLPPIAPSDPAPALDYPMDENDQWGCCVVAGWDHFAQVVNTLLAGAYTNLTRDELLALYRTQNPNFDPDSDSNHNGPGSSADGGMVIQLFLEELVRQGKILGFAKVDHTNPAVLAAAVYVFEGVLTGVNLQQAQVEGQFEDGVWDWVPGAGFIGGHCIPVVGYGQAVTWGKVVELTAAFVNAQMQEAWVLVTKAHLDHPAFRDNFDLAGFAQAYTAITGNPFPGSPVEET